MQQQPKTHKVHVRADGSRYTLHFEGGYWFWDHGRGSFPQSAAIENIKREGGRVEIVPNRNYREPHPFEILGRYMSGRR
jgi:hypothetical protein